MDDIITQRKRHNAKDGEKSRQRFGRAVQKIPFLGRLFAHSAVLYWDQLDRCVPNLLVCYEVCEPMPSTNAFFLTTEFP